MQEPIEQTIKEEEQTRRKGNFKKGLITTLAASMIGYGMGRMHEAKNNNFYQIKTKVEITKLAMEGYTFTEDSDPTFYLYTPKLEINPSNKSMRGSMQKEDGTSAGPVRTNGRIGYTVPERTIQEGKKTLEQLKEKGKEIFEYGREKVDSLNHKYFNKQKEQNIAP